MFGDVTAVFIAGVESDHAADSDNDSLFEMDNFDGDVPDTPVGAKAR